MQTFLPYPDFERTAKCLDYRRLGKQRIEARQIVDTLEGKSSGWRNHPAVKMWRGHVPALKEYYNAILREWIRRGYKNTMKFYVIDEKVIYPNWLGGEIHDSHKSNLLRKDAEHYGFDVPNNLPYVWPEE